METEGCQKEKHRKKKNKHDEKQRRKKTKEEERKKSQLASPPVDCCFVYFVDDASVDGALAPAWRVLDRTKGSAWCRGVLGGDVTLGMPPSIILTTKKRV